MSGAELDRIVSWMHDLTHVIMHQPVQVMDAAAAPAVVRSHSIHITLGQLLTALMDLITSHQRQLDEHLDIHIDQHGRRKLGVVVCTDAGSIQILTLRLLADPPANLEIIIRGEQPAERYGEDLEPGVVNVAICNKLLHIIDISSHDAEEVERKRNALRDQIEVNLVEDLALRCLRDGIIIFQHESADQRNEDGQLDDGIKRLASGCSRTIEQRRKDLLTELQRIKQVYEDY